jgi:hypothetical protein
MTDRSDKRLSTRPPRRSCHCYRLGRSCEHRLRDSSLFTYLGSSSICQAYSYDTTFDRIPHLRTSLHSRTRLPTIHYLLSHNIHLPYRYLPLQALLEPPRQANPKCIRGPSTRVGYSIFDRSGTQEHQPGWRTLSLSTAGRWSTCTLLRGQEQNSNNAEYNREKEFCGSRVFCQGLETALGKVDGIVDFASRITTIHRYSSIVTEQNSLPYSKLRLLETTLFLLSIK